MADREQTKKDFKSWRGEFFKPETRGAYALEDLTSHFKSKKDLKSGLRPDFYQKSTSHFKSKKDLKDFKKT